MARTRTGADVRTHDGAIRFARYAYPPNELGYCGPGEHAELLERVHAHAAGPGLDHLARGFEGAWPYLALLAGHTGRDPLDPDVVDAYWIGNRLLEAVPGHDLLLSLDERFRTRGNVAEVVDPVRHGALPHHSLHVLAVYPWAGLLRSGRTDPSLEVMERCLVRWGTVLDTDESGAMVEVVTLGWNGGRLFLGPPRTERFVRALDGRRLADVETGDTVAVHWQWVCDVLGPADHAALVATTCRNLAAVNASHPMPEPVG